MLTRKQHELLMFIHERIKETGVSPSLDEMKEALDLASKSGIHRLITALEERGFLRRLPHRARALEVVRLPEEATPGARGRAPFKPQVIENTRAAAANDIRELPCWGVSPPARPSTPSSMSGIGCRSRNPCWGRASTSCWRSRATP